MSPYSFCLVAGYLTLRLAHGAIFTADTSFTIGGSSGVGSQERQAGDTLELNCEAKFQIDWAWPNNSIYKGWSDPVVDGRLDVSPLSQNSQGKYSRRIRVLNLNHADTGRYYCYEKGNKERSLDHYVFVEDFKEDHIFLHWVESDRPYSKLLPFYENRESYIDCLVTHPEATVQLLIGNHDTELSRSYDPRSGFVIAPHQLAAYSTDKGAISSCVATLPDGRTDEVKFLLLGLTAKSDIDISFNDTTAQHAYRGGSVELDCTGSGDQSFTLRCNWIFPAQNEKPSSRIQTDVYQESSTSQSISLKIYPLKLSDEGNYTCQCDDHGAGAINSSSAWIPVSPTRGQIKLLEQSNNVTVQTGNRVEFWIKFKVWPAEWTKSWLHHYISPLYGHENRSIHGQDPRISVLSQSNGPFLSTPATDIFQDDLVHTEKLIIADTAASDSGEYVVNIEVADTMFVYKFHLSVKSAQLSSQLSVTPNSDLSTSVDRRFLYLGNNYNIICLGTGYPLAHLEMQWKPCVNNQVCQWATVTTQGHLLDGTFQRALILRKSVTESGTYNCIAQDANDSSMPNFSVQQEMIVTDIPNSEQNEGMENSVHHIRGGNDGDPQAVYQEDEFSMECAVQKYDYSQVTWYLERLDSDNNTIDKFLGDDLQSTRGYNVTYNDKSPYSNKLSINFKKIQPGNSGTYRCEAVLNPDPIPRTRKITVMVLPVSRPKFTDWTSNYYVKANYSAPFTLKCGATGSPTPVVEWWKNETVYHGRPGITISADKTKLIISRVVAEDAGSYTCRAKNRGGALSKRIQLTVLGAPKPEGVLGTTGIVILCVCLVFAGVIVLILLTFVCILKRRERAKTALLQGLYDQLMSSAKDGEGQASLSPRKLDPNKPVNRQAENLPYDRRYELSRNWLRLNNVLGEGQFGRVLRGTLKVPSEDEEDGQRYSFIREPALTVAVKIPLNGRSLQHQKALLDELKVMIYIGKHINVLELIGAVTKNMVKGELYVVVELCSLGSLLDYLRSHRKTFVTEIVPRSPSSPPPKVSVVSNDGYLQPNHLLPEQQQQITTYQSDFDSSWSQELNENRLTRSFLSTSDLLSYSYQTANGMEFLASKNLIHRDLAARNLLLTENQTVKIADFGLARQDQIYHIQSSKHVPLPIKWMALESITHQDFTVMSDVWSFGVVMWEFFSLGEIPYPSQPLDPTFVTFLKEGNRLEHPQHSPDEVFKLMQQCWLTELSERPTFAEAKEVLGIQLQRCSPQLFNQLCSENDVVVYEEANSSPNANLPVYYNSPDLSASSAAVKLNIPKILQGFREIPQDDPDSLRLSSSLENQSYMLQDMGPIRSAKSHHAGYINSPS